MHLILSYMKAHIYELHSIFCATITFLLMMPLKVPIKKRIWSWIEKKANTNKKWEQHFSLYYKRCNMVILLLAILIACMIFIIVSFLSPLISFSWNSMGLSGVFALAEYEIYDELR